MLDWEPVNRWTNTFYALIQALHTAKQIDFGNLTMIDANVRTASAWISPDCTYTSALSQHPFGNRKITFRRDPNKHFDDIARHTVKMLIQDLVVILDQMMTKILNSHGKQPANFPHSKVEQLRKGLDARYMWAAQGCLELIAVRNVLVHSEGKWNARSIAIVKPFLAPAPQQGKPLSIGFSMLFRYRKAMRTFLNQVA